MNKILKVLVLLPAIAFIVIGVNWLVAPSGIAPTFGLSLEKGVGLSSQVGDMAGFFITLGSCMLIALISQQRSWYYPAIMLLLITAIGRVIAWIVHDATFAADMIGLEIVVAIVLIAASRVLATGD